MSVNKAIIIGRLGVDPESRSFPNGGSVCNLRIATSESWKDKQTGERKERTEWHRIVLQNKLGEIAQQYLKKGSQVYIEGSIRTRKWQNQQGEDQYITEVVGRNMTMLDNKSNDGQESKTSRGSGYSDNQGKSAQNNQESYADNDFDDLDIPF